MKSWLTSNCNEKTISAKTVAIFKTHLLCASNKIFWHEVFRKKDNQLV